MNEEKKKTIKQLKQRAKEMLNNNYKRKIGDEEIYTIICEWENALNLIDKLQKENVELKEENFDQVYMKAIADYKEKIRNKIKELENIKLEQEEVDYSRIKFATIVLEELLEEE